MPAQDMRKGWSGSAALSRRGGRGRLREVFRWDRQGHPKCCAPGRGRLHFDSAAVLFRHRQGNGEAETGSSAGPFGSEKRVKQLSGIFRRNPGTIVRERRGQVSFRALERDFQCAMIADTRYGLLRDSDKVLKHPRQELGVTHDGGERRRRLKINDYIFLPERSLLKLQGALDQLVQPHGRPPQRRGARKGKKVLNDAGGAASLLQDGFDLPASSFVGGAFAQEVAHAEDG